MKLKTKSMCYFIRHFHNTKYDNFSDFTKTDKEWTNNSITSIRLTI